MMLRRAIYYWAVLLARGIDNVANRFSTPWHWVLALSATVLLIAPLTGAPSIWLEGWLKIGLFALAGYVALRLFRIRHKIQRFARSLLNIWIAS